MTHQLIKAKIIGTGSYLPEKRETAADFLKKGASQELIDDWGVFEHRVMGDHETVIDMEANAANAAIKRAGIKPADIDLILSGTGMPMQIAVPNSNALQYKIGAKNAAAFDISMACASSIPQMVVAAQFVASQGYKYVLITGSSHLTRVADPTDPASYIVLGDGAGAIIMTQTREERGILSYDMQTRGEYFDYCGVKIKRPKYSPEEPRYYDHNREKPYFYIEDPINTSSGIGRYLITSVPATVEKALARADMTRENVDFFIFHQNVAPLTGKWLKIIGVPEEKTHVTYAKYGNMTSANIFVNLDEAVQMNKIKRGDIVLFAGQGAGFSVGSIVMKW